MKLNIETEEDEILEFDVLMQDIQYIRVMNCGSQIPLSKSFTIELSIIICFGFTESLLSKSFSEVFCFCMLLSRDGK